MFNTALKIVANGSVIASTKWAWLINATPT